MLSFPPSYLLLLVTLFTAEVDLNAMEERMKIRNSIQQGNIQEGIERVNDLNPEVFKLFPYPPFLSLAVALFCLLIVCSYLSASLVDLRF